MDAEVEQIVRRMKQNGHAETVARVRSLRRAAEDGGDGISAASLRGLERLLDVYGVRNPDLTVGPHGRIMAEWEGDGSLVMEFLDSGDVEFARTYGPAGGRRRYLNGALPLADVMEYVGGFAGGRVQ